MSGIGRFLMDAITNPFKATESTSKVSFSFEHPTTADILIVKRLVFQASRRELPLELIDIIIDHAEYWRCVTSQTNKAHLATGEMHGASTDRSDKLLLRSYPLGYDPAGKNKYQLPEDCLTHNVFQAYEIDSNPYPAAEGDLTQEVLDDWQTHYQRRGEYLCRKIVFTLKSHDQGWGDNRLNKGTYQGSCTWFDVGKESFQAVSDNAQAALNVVGSDRTLHAVTKLTSPTGGAWGVFKTLDVHPSSTSADGEPVVLESHTNPSHRRLQSNRTATLQTKDYTIIWACTDDVCGQGDQDGNGLNDLALDLEAQGRGSASLDGTFIRSLKVGDVVTLWARARFPGWRNVVEFAKMEIYWAV